MNFTPWLLVAFLAATLLEGKPQGGCRCWEGYKASNGPNGLECAGILLLHSMPCNEPQPPQCKCSGSVTGILKDNTGIWCSVYADAKEVQRWECENVEEWRKFYQQNPEYKS